MSAQTGKIPQTKNGFRAKRLMGRPDKFRGFVQYNDTQAAQFGDISSSGMRLISRHPTQVKVSDTVRLEFNLPGVEETFQRTAVVVRRKGEFEFAVQFVPDANDANLKKAIGVYNEQINRFQFVEQIINLRDWAIAHRRGILFSLLGLLIIGGIAAGVFMFSDEYNGRLRAWGDAYPKEWSLNYYK